MVSLDAILLYIKQSITILGVLVITCGALRSLYQLVILIFFKKLDIDDIRFEFGRNVMLGLDFIVGADIIGSLVEPNYYNLGLLALLVFIRIILSFFLNQELEGLKKE